METVNPASLPPTPVLAYLGDAVHSLYIREMLVRRGIPKAGELNRLTLDYVTAARQAEALRAVRPFLTEAEEDLVRRAGNSHHLSRPHNASIADYRAATSFEALLGMHRYLGNHDRIEELLHTAYGSVAGLSDDGKAERTINDSED